MRLSKIETSMSSCTLTSSTNSRDGTLGTLGTLETLMSSSCRAAVVDRDVTGCADVDVDVDEERSVPELPDRDSWVVAGPPLVPSTDDLLETPSAAPLSPPPAPVRERTYVRFRSRLAPNAFGWMYSSDRNGPCNACGKELGPASCRPQGAGRRGPPPCESSDMHTGTCTMTWPR